MKIYKRVLSLVIALALVVGLIPMSAITANAYSWDLKNGGTVTSGQTATITCYGGAAYQITNFEWDCTSNTIATITGTDASGEVIYTRQINGSPYITKTFCYGGEQYVIDVIKGSIEISYNTANTVAPKITVTENYSDVPTASAYDYILVENSTSDDDYFYVTVAYNLVSHEQGAIMFGVESNNSGSFTILADLEHIVSAGVGRHTFTIPREEVNDEDVYVNISPYPHGDSWNPLDADEFKLKLTSSDDLLNQRENYYTITKPTFSILGSGENQLVGQDGYVVNYNGSQYTTNSTGRVLISDTNDPTEDVLITKEGYYDHKIPKEVIRNFNRVYMHKNTVQEPYLDNFYMRYDGSNAWENVLYNSIYFTEMSSQAFDIYVSANWCGQSAMKVYLQQGEVKLELTEGFNENVVLGSSFSATGGTIYLCLETVGKTYKFSPKIFVDNYNLELDMDLGSQDEAEISDDIQGVGGEKLKISCSMLDFLPVGVSVAADGTVTGTIGIKAEDKHQATWYDEIKKSVSSHDETKIAETFKKLKKAEVPKWESKSSIGIGVDMSIIGYFTAHVVKESPNPDLVGTLQIDNIECAISIEGNVSASVQQFYGVVPVYWATELGLKLAFAFEMQKETPESSWEVEMPRMEIEISISGSGSLGVSKIVGAGLKASGAVTITIHAPDYNFDSSSCYVQVTTYVIGEILTFKGEKDFWESDKEYLWGEEYEESLEATSFSLFSDHPQIISRSMYYAAQSEMARRNAQRSKSEDSISGRGRYSGKHALSELLVCAECGSHYRRKYHKKKDGAHYYWRCISRLENGDKYCSNSKGLEEELLKKTICEALSSVLAKRENGYEVLKSRMIYAAAGDEHSNELYVIEMAISDAMGRIDELTELAVKFKSNRDKYDAAIGECNEQLRVLREKKENILEQLNHNEKARKEMERIEKHLTEDMVVIPEFNDGFIRRMVTSIRVTQDNNLQICIKGGYEIMASFPCDKNAA